MTAIVEPSRSPVAQSAEQLVLVSLVVKQSNEYMREYMARRREARRAELRGMLGGRCAVCGSTEGLEFDHIDHATKSFSIGMWIDRKWELLLQEVAKCQLLCNAHHIEKTRQERTVPHGGGVSGRRNCKCEPCKARKAEYMKCYTRPSQREAIPR